jgi:hypothetical protein
MVNKNPKDAPNKLDRVVLEARRAREQRESDYRAQALKLDLWPLQP